MYKCLLSIFILDENLMIFTVCNHIKSHSSTILMEKAEEEETNIQFKCNVTINRKQSLVEKERERERANHRQ